MRLIDADALKGKIPYLWSDPTDIGMLLDLIDNVPTLPLPDFKEGYKQAILDGKTNYVRPCENCDLYFKAKTKEEMKKGGAE